MNNPQLVEIVVGLAVLLGGGAWLWIAVIATSRKVREERRFEERMRQRYDRDSASQDEHINDPDAAK